jgi:histidinol-phosphate aminotransferase
VAVPRYQWQPTTRAIAQRLGIPEQDVIRFDHNTSPFSTDWAPAIVVESARDLNEYPAADYRAVREAAARYVGVEPENIVPGAGIDELLLLAARAFLEPGGVAATQTPTYPLYHIATLQQHARLIEVPLEEPDFGSTIKPFLTAAWDADLVWLCIPNNPTGSRLTAEDLAAVITATDGVVVLDAAYAEIAGDSWGPWIERYPNLVICHTLSKGFGLAGARVGFAVAGEALVDAIDGVRPPGSISSLSVGLAIAALDEPNRMRRNVDRIVRERSRLAAALDGLGLGVLPSEANFLLCHVGGIARELADALMAGGLVVRRFPEDGPLEEYLRFTVRSPAEDDRLVAAMASLLP